MAPDSLVCPVRWPTAAIWGSAGTPQNKPSLTDHRNGILDTHAGALGLRVERRDKQEDDFSPKKDPRLVYGLRAGLRRVPVVLPNAAKPVFERTR